MTAIREGKLKKQPLFYVLTSIRFQPWMLVVSKIPEIQDRLREQFPVFNTIAMGPALFAPIVGENGASSWPQAQPQPVAWTFHRSDRRVGCQISRDQLVVHALEYGGFSSFAQTVKFVVETLLAHSRHLDINSMGIRYLDRISPSDGESLSEYVPAEILPFRCTNPAFTLQGGHAQSSYKTPAGLLQVRFWAGENMLCVPDDLIPLYMITQDLSSISKENKSPLPPLGEREGILDTDSIWTTESPHRMNADDIINRISELHVHANQFFRAACTEHAFEVWQGLKT